MVIMVEEEKGVKEEEEERPKKNFNQNFNRETNARLD